MGHSEGVEIEMVQTCAEERRWVMGNRMLKVELASKGKGRVKMRFVNSVKVDMLVVK